jgi:hypothetical protein
MYAIGSRVISPMERPTSGPNAKFKLVRVSEPESGEQKAQSCDNA